MADCFDIYVTGMNKNDLSSRIGKEFVMSVPHCAALQHTSYLETIFGKQITDQIVCLIVHMWNPLPLLSLSFWQAAFQVKQNIVERVSTDHFGINVAAYSTGYTNMNQIWSNTTLVCS